VATTLYKETIPSDLSQMSATIRGALSVLEEHGWLKADGQFELHLCLEEALVNAINHGNRGNPGLSVSIEILEKDGTCCIRVHDEGAGFHPAEVPEPDASTEGGRGICLIKHFMDSVKYIPELQCLEMCFRKKGCKGAKTNE